MRDFSPVLLGDRRKHSKDSMAPPDVTFIFAEDVVEWDTYLSRQFEGSGVVINHEQVEKMSFPLPCKKTAGFSDARVVLVILSPAMVTFMDNNATNSFQFTRLLKPNKTIAMLCGVTSASLSGVRDVLICYDDWRHLEAKDKDITMVRNVIELIQEMLQRSRDSERLYKSKFKLVPRKVQEGNGKVYVMLAKPVDSNAKLKITLECNGVREVPAKRRNPYTLVFVIPDDMMKAQNLVNCYVWCGEELLGISPVKCVTKMGELYSLLTSVSSPYEFLYNTLGIASLHEVDTYLTNIFQKNLPKSGFELLHPDGKYSRYQTKEEFPTLLHFAARHGLNKLVRELLKCPFAQAAANLKNIRSLTPAQLANHAGHNEVVADIEEFLKTCSQEKQTFEMTVIETPSDSNLKCSDPTDYYDIPGQPVPVLLPPPPPNHLFGNLLIDKDNEYLKAKDSHKENIQPSQNFPMGISDKVENNHDTVNKPFGNADKKLSLLESQAKLIEIMEAYKKGASLIDVERLHNEWKVLYQVSDLEAKSTLDGLRSLYAKAQKAKLNKKHSSSFSELRQFLHSKLRRKESIGSKINLSRKNSKDMSSTDKLCPESDPTRPVSTLSVLSNTSSSSGSSFDRLSMASAGSDSGHHSDSCDDRNNKLKFESRYHIQPRNTTLANTSVNIQKNLQCLTLNSRPPAPPPRPAKPTSHYGSLEDCKQVGTPQYAVLKKLKHFDYLQPDSKSSTLNDFRSVKKPSSLFIDLDDPNGNYDCPPPPRPNCSVNQVVKNSMKPSSPHDPKTDYDLVPPPLPVSSPPRKQDVLFSDFEQSYDIPPPAVPHSFQRSNSISSNYDFPKTTFMDNTDTQAACTCQTSTNTNNLSSVKSCCVGNKLSSLKRVNNLPSVPNSDIVMNIEKKKERKNINAVHNQYYNVCLRSPKDIDIDNRDSIPEEMAPPPPIIENESPEEHYKMVGAPIPVSAANKVA